MQSISYFAVADWTDKDAYPGDDISAKAPEALLQRLRSDGLNEDSIRQTLWRWQFLRRHPNYQMGWFRRDRQNGYLYGLYCEFCPNPEEEYPDELSYYTDSDGNFCPVGHSDVWLAQQDPSILNPIDKMLQTIMREAHPLMQRYFFELPHAKSDRTRPIRNTDRVRSLRVLDALAAGATGAEIERELYNSTDKGKGRLVHRARKALIDYTGIRL